MSKRPCAEEIQRLSPGVASPLSRFASESWRGNFRLHFSNRWKNRRCLFAGHALRWRVQSGTQFSEGVVIPFAVEFVRGQSVYAQIMDAAKRAILSGQLAAGDMFPEQHDLVKELRIHPASARRASAELLKEGWLTGELDGRLVVAALSPALVAQRSRLLRPAVTGLVKEAQRLGVSRDEVVRLIGEAW